MSWSAVLRYRPPPAFRCLDCEAEAGPRTAVKLLSKDEARRIAANIAKLPVLMDRTKTEPQARRSGLFRVLALGTFSRSAKSEPGNKIWGLSGDTASQ
jgi:hypothetical protein